MSVIVNGMKMPERCSECPFRLVWCRERIYMDKRPDRCHLIELPEKHGRLIEEPKDFDYSGLAMIAPLDFKGTAEYFARQVKAQPTIIEAEGDDEC